MISIIMPSFNAERYISEAIASILNQSYKNFELIIVDDASNDNSWSIIKNFKDKRIRYVRNKRKIGVAASLNKGIKMARGEYIARMDADDVSERNRLESQYVFLQKHTSVALVGTAITVIDKNGDKKEKKTYPKTHQEIKKAIIRYNPFVHPSIMMRRSVFKQIGLYNEYFDGAEDYELFFRIVKKYKTANLPNVLLQYRFGSGRTYFPQAKQAEWKAILARFRAIFYYGYPKWKLVFTIKPIISFFIPISVKRFMLS